MQDERVGSSGLDLSGKCFFQADWSGPGVEWDAGRALGGCGGRKAVRLLAWALGWRPSLGLPQYALSVKQNLGRQSQRS